MASSTLLSWRVLSPSPSKIREGGDSSNASPQVVPTFASWCLLLLPSKLSPCLLWTSYGSLFWFSNVKTLCFADGGHILVPPHWIWISKNSFHQILQLIKSRTILLPFSLSILCSTADYTTIPWFSQVNICSRGCENWWNLMWVSHQLLRCASMYCGMHNSKETEPQKQATRLQKLLGCGGGETYNVQEGCLTIA
jgi:hypothetical protein